ncbi:heme lyase CcmF/NrfE family subunit [candidate division KSB1 bacterium]|nr:heme lyase CcmF/NrfE family subunit [candidate division KSB1 bacterium]
MILFGQYSLVIAFVLTLYASFLYFRADKKRFHSVIASAQRATLIAFLMIVTSSLLLLYALLSRNFQVEYVAQYTNRSLPIAYTIAAFWAGQAGSLLFWALLLSFFTWGVMLRTPHKNTFFFSRTLAVLSVTLSFFLYLLIFKSNPFATTPFTPEDGIGLNPLLQNPAMIFHPPALYVGFVAYTIPFSYAIAALLSKKPDDYWLFSIRRWSLFAWLFLTIGNILGMQWAYVELGWGGYWAWDPVENASLLPWLTGTAFIHSVIIQQRRGMFKKWNFSLIIITFALTIFGTFITRSGLISSVHAFGVSNLGPAFLLFLAIVLIGSFILLIRQTPLLSSRARIDSWTSKESSFLLNNILLTIFMVSILVGTLFPAISEAISGEKLTVGSSFFNALSVPVGLTLFFILGICVLFSWQKTRFQKLLSRFAISTTTTCLVVVLLVLAGVREMLPLIAFAVFAFAMISVLFEFSRQLLRYKNSAKDNGSLGFFRFFIKNRQRYGGFLVHIGILLLFLGIIGSSAYSIEKTVTLEPGDSVAIANYQIHYTGLQHVDRGDTHIDRARFVLNKSRPNTRTLFSEKIFHRNYQPVTEVGIYSNLREDVYIILAKSDEENQRITASILINPLVLWMWIGGAVMVLGTLLAFTNKSRAVRQ